MWIRAHKSFTTLKTKIATTPILRHFDETRTPVVIVYVSDWATSASLTQEHDGTYHPVAFASRALKTNELNYNVTEKEVLALLRGLDLYYNLLIRCEIRVLTRHFALAWLFKSTGLQGRLGQWSSLLAPWTLEITKCTKGEDEILGAIAVSITPRSENRRRSDRLCSRKEPKRRIQAPIPTVDREEELWMISFDGSARVKRGGAAFSTISTRMGGGKARSGYLEGLTVNEAEYNGLILGLDMLEDLAHKRLVVYGDSNFVIRQVPGEFDCKAPGLTLLKQKALNRLRKWSEHELVHMKRDWNGSADSLASAALQQQSGIEAQRGPGTENPVVRVSAVTTRASRVRLGFMQEDLIREMGVDRIKRAQEEGVWITGMKKYLSGAIADLTEAEARSYGKIAADYEVGEQDLLFYCSPTPRSGDDRDQLLRLVNFPPITTRQVPETLQSDVLHHYHITLEGGHRGVGRTYQRSRTTSTGEDYIGASNDMELVGDIPVPDHCDGPHTFAAQIPQGEYVALIWVDLFTGYVIAKASSSRSAQTVAESYEECVFRRFGASEMIRHDREPGFMSDFFRAFDKILGQRCHIGHKPTGLQKEWALKMYVRDLDQKDWDKYAERLTFAINTAHNRIRGDTLTIWYPRSTLEATLPVGCTRRRNRDVRRWRYRIKRYYQQSREKVNARLKDAIADQAGRHNEDFGSHQIEAGSRVWLYLEPVKEGYERNLAHMWHGLFRVADTINEFRIKLEIVGTGYQIFPVVHVSKLKLVKDFPDRPRVELTVDESDRLDFDEILLPEDRSRAREYEVERISVVRSGKKTGFGRIYREFLVHWAGYDEPTWPTMPISTAGQY
ncbi:LOW QUALITY PROTEIN: reverse transcriptase [Phytophthora megakarya]|uniref:Reverse transcriptase n=1 Tax=Phytophthora megakarya TaxID=4795 RepID=A0A225VEJ5_9STRA|nr:LOW QUALITY PROTEIN: reverse transcriptase [Phytophthora megakarya]